MPVPTVCAIVPALAGCVCDLRTGRIPNLLAAVTALSGFVFHVAIGVGSGPGFSVAGACVGLLLLFPVFALGGMGAGDVKLMAALGAWLGPTDAMWTALYGAAAAGIMAVAVAFAQGYLRTAFANVWRLLGFWRVVGFRPLEGMTLASSKSPRLPYALPITVGLLVTLWFH
jgi:prepilin peptidase CpaA